MSEAITENIAQSLDTHLETLTSEQRTSLVIELLNTLSAQDLQVVLETAEALREKKLQEAKTAAIAEMKSKFDALGISLAEVLDEVNKHPAKKQQRHSGGEGVAAGVHFS